MLKSNESQDLSPDKHLEEEEEEKKEHQSHESSNPRESNSNSASLEDKKSGSMSSS